MTPQVPPYRARLREAQGLFRAKEQSRAFELARDLYKTHPQAEDVTAFYTAAARYINGMVRKNIRAENHDMTIYYARMLFEDPTFRDAAQTALLDAARAGLAPRARVDLLYPLCRTQAPSGVVQVADPAPYWREIALCIQDLPADARNIDLGFDVLSVLPGHTVALDGLATLVAQEQGLERGALARSGARSVVEAAQIAGFTATLKPRLRPAMDPAARRAVYARLRREALQAPDPQTPPDRHRVLLAVEFAIQDAEQAVGGGSAPEEKKTDVWSLLDPTSQHYALGEGLVLTGPTAAVLARKPPHATKPRKTVMGHLAMITSLWLHAMNREASQDRIGYVWLVMDPLIQIMVICIIPLVLQPEQIYDMATFPFAVIGACFWLVFRVSAIGALSGGGVLKPQLEHPAIRRFDIMVARSLNALINYCVAGVALLGVAMFMGLTDGPEHLPFFMLCFLVSWIVGLSYGTIINSLIQIYPGLRRINAYSLRFIGLMSALFYTPEQLPPAMAEVVWYNPLLHIVQLARTYWFASYTSPDTSVTYIFFWAAILAVLALVFLVIDEKRPGTVRA